MTDKRLLFAACLLALLTACLDESVVDCADGRVCPAQLACDQAHHGCVLPQQLDICKDEPQGTSCSYRGVPNGSCYEQVCLPSGCGNGVVDMEEACDDSNRFHGDGCSADCRSKEVCGNGYVDVTLGEQCERKSESDPWCRDDCVSVTCGDGVLDTDAFELCDKGEKNSNEPDAICRQNCQPRRCGDNVVDSGEVCDDGNAKSGDGCAADCRSNEKCGNGVVDGDIGESCEPNASNASWCRPNCVSVRCGDGEVDRDAFEQCDKGPDNSIAPDAACRPNCQPRRCGDGIQDSDELCDDGNRLNSDGCSHDCKSFETCGNGYLDQGRGEACDDGNLRGHDGCSSRCTNETATWRNISVPENGYGLYNVAYDPTRDTTVDLSFTVTYEVRGTAWHVLSPEHLPRVSYTPGMAWDSKRRRVVLFGGQNQVDSDETWEWDGSDWQQRIPATTTPFARNSPTLVYDVVRGRTIMFGGFGMFLEPPWIPETWEWDGNDWRELTATGAPPSGNYAATFDPLLGQVVAFDGTALWYLEGDAWRSVPAALPSTNRSLVFDIERGRLVCLDSGLGEATAYSLFEWDGSAWQPLTPPPGPPDSSARLVYSTARRRLVLLTSYSSRNVIWEWDGAAWTDSDRTQEAWGMNGAMARDTLRGSTLLFGGITPGEPPNDSAVSQTWLHDGAAWRQQLPLTQPPPRTGHAMAYDPIARKVVLFGGWGWLPNTVNASTFLGDTWLWDGENWSEASSASAPSPRGGHAMAYDAARRQVVLFGGTNDEGSWNDLWTWDGETWTYRELAERPAWRYGHGLSYDPIRREVVLAGGDGDPLVSGDTPTWTWDGERWLMLGIPALGHRYYFGTTYDANRMETVLVGGYFNDHVRTWLLPAVPSATPARAWQEMSVPFRWEPVVYGHNVVYDPLEGRTLAYSWQYRPTFEMSYRAEGELYEVCQHGYDIDGDGLIGCKDPDCWGYCTPLCPPGTECDDSLPRCGDGTCNTALETCRMCPEDCGACEPLCGDFFCDPGETNAHCPGDCANPLGASP